MLRSSGISCEVVAVDQISVQRGNWSYLFVLSQKHQILTMFMNIKWKYALLLMNLIQVIVTQDPHGPSCVFSFSQKATFPRS
jgi:hypothetical protein